MWKFARYTSLKDSGIFKAFTDWHCHLLPGVDDGVQTVEESLQILDLYEKLGICEVWLTPHIMEDMPNSTSSLKDTFVRLQTAYQGNIELHLAAEYMIDYLFEKKLNNKDLLPLGKYSNHLLVETSYFNPPMGLENILSRIIDSGYYPVLAHPERYIYMNENNYRQLKNLGVKFQFNLLSIVGMYSKSAKEKAKWLLRNGLYDLTGSDTHSFNHFKNMIDKRLSWETASLIIKYNRIKI